MCTVKLPPAARSVGPQLSTCGAEPEIEHRPGFDWESIDHVTPDPEPAGSGSLTDTPFAVPVPLFLTVTANPIASPAFTDAASAVLVIWIAAQFTVTLALMDDVPSSVVVTLG